ncbi:TetR family transcriptional regulator [Pseudomonas cichorii]|uniref:TetR family transcriptional regulator n=1 Tax=Pseudomonas serbiensis TaxID=3064350 RepID=A0ABT9CQ55_9PSED|nr:MULTISPECIES: TetR family transcriptional regulator [Pseudomonas]MDO7927535.1 TetR family transcriptional regulator [Pseudomonas sp. KFB-138]GFM79900.1 TetR family transcriptional regulator [Pseudomonas cichorii]GFM85346.1 TetR family transcriptional regulator [Pseudomonas cichorii]
MVRRTKEEAQVTRSHILQAAEQAFDDRGIARTTLADIATLAGVTRGAIYWHFTNKAELVQAMLDSLREPLEDMAQASESETEADPLGWMRKLLIHLFHEVALDPQTRRINEILFHKCEFTDEMCDFRRQRQANAILCHERIGRALSNAVRRGQLPASLDVKRASICLFSYINGIIYQWLLVPDSFSLSGEAEQLVDSCMDMLQYSPALRA